MGRVQDRTADEVIDTHSQHKNTAHEELVGRVVVGIRKILLSDVGEGDSVLDDKNFASGALLMGRNVL